MYKEIFYERRYPTFTIEHYIDRCHSYVDKILIIDLVDRTIIRIPESSIVMIILLVLVKMIINM